MQDEYFTLWLGKWTTAIDWTAAVMGTYLAATLSSLSQSVDYTVPGIFHKSSRLDGDAQMVENEVNKYFAQSISYYFGEDYFAIRMQAFDDMLWVVLGWLESIQFIESHSDTHYPASDLDGKTKGKSADWYGSQFTPSFGHRARVFYELAEEGWDWRLCGGGMTWNPRLLPYKNAITNQLFISASISMYLHFPGDENCSPFLSQHDRKHPRTGELYDECDKNVRGQYDPVYLANALNGHEWLQHSGMINKQGLYVDGFHIEGYRWNHSKTTCDERNEMVYTYNQGVILSGLRGLWEATGNISYLEDGYRLVDNVIRATGWTAPDTFSTASSADQPPQEKEPDKNKSTSFSDWSGIGNNGILTELCDPSGSCNQDAQTFKGIFFHHLTAFCTPLPAHPVKPGKTHAATRDTATLHQRTCDDYARWVIHNAQAALRTRDSKGRFGAWWNAPDTSSTLAHERNDMHLATSYANLFPHGAVDYRNAPTDDVAAYGDTGPESATFTQTHNRGSTSDLNDRGRGRTVETQSSGLAVVRAMWEFVRRAEGSVDGLL